MKDNRQFHHDKPEEIDLYQFKNKSCDTIQKKIGDIFIAMGEPMNGDLQRGLFDKTVAPLRRLKGICRGKLEGFYADELSADRAAIVTEEDIKKVLKERESECKYTPRRYSQYWYGILDTEKDLMVWKDDKHLLLFHSKDEAQKTCDELCKNDRVELCSNGRLQLKEDSKKNLILDDLDESKLREYTSYKESKIRESETDFDLEGGKYSWYYVLPEVDKHFFNKDEAIEYAKSIGAHEVIGNGMWHNKVVWFDETDIFDYLENTYNVDYNQRVEDLMEDFDLSEDEAKAWVDKWEPRAGMKESYKLEVFDKDGKTIDYQAGFRSPSEARGFIYYNDDRYPAGYTFRITESKLKLKEGNPLTYELPAKVDKLLQDLAQMYIEDLTYSHIIHHNYTPVEIKKLKFYAKECEKEIEEGDIESYLNEVVIPSVCRIFGLKDKCEIKKNSEVRGFHHDKKYLYFGNDKIGVIWDDAPEDCGIKCDPIYEKFKDLIYNYAVKHIFRTPGGEEYSPSIEFEEDILKESKLKESFILQDKKKGGYLKGVENNKLVHTDDPREAMSWTSKESADNNCVRYGDWQWMVVKFNKDFYKEGKKEMNKEEEKDKLYGVYCYCEKAPELQGWVGDNANYKNPEDLFKEEDPFVFESREEAWLHLQDLISSDILLEEYIMSDEAAYTVKQLPDPHSHNTRKEESLNKNNETEKMKEADEDYLKIGNRVYPGSIKTADMNSKEIEDSYNAEKKAKAEEEQRKIAKEKAKKIRKQVEEKGAKTPEDKLIAYFNALVPSTGSCETLAGEIVRAINRIEYRRWNDGDYFFTGYGLETCGPAAVFLCDNAPENIQKMVSDLAYECVNSAEGYDPSEDFKKIEPIYEEGIQNIIKAVVNYLDSSDEPLVTKNPCDMFTCDPDGYFPDLTYTYSFEIDTDVLKFVDSGDISEQDIINEVDSWLSRTSGIDISIEFNEVLVENLTPDDFYDLERIIYGNNNTWQDPWRPFIDSLYEEYGDPDEEDEEEED